MSEKFKLIPDQMIFEKNKKQPPYIKPPKGNPEYIRTPQKQIPPLKPHR